MLGPGQAKPQDRELDVGPRQASDATVAIIVTGFAQPGRGSAEAYDRYLAGMDASLRQKVALVAAHLLCEGQVADLGTGSGGGAHALAALYPRLQVTGVDVDPTMVERARERHALPNLHYVVGDVAEPVFAPGSQDGLFDSSILHHVTSYGGYRYDNARRALAVQAAQLAVHGVLIVRDFLAPPGGDVLLEVPDDDGVTDGDDPATCSTAALLRRFAREFRSLSSAPGFALEELAPAGSPAWPRFRLSRRLAVEFLLRKDYRADWVAEVQEEYCIFDQPTFEEVFESLGLRVLVSSPIANPWIVRNRLAGRYRWSDPDGRPLPHPATNYIIVGERVPAGHGVRFRIGPKHSPLSYLLLSTVRRTDTGELRDLARRPHPTLDLVPHFVSGPDLYVLARMSYPRPLLDARPADPPLDGQRPPHFVTEPLTLVQRDAPLGRTIEEYLASYAGLAPGSIRGVEPGTTYYPSPGGIEEEVRSALVEVEPIFANVNPGSRSGFSSSGRVGAIAAHQVLRAAQVGGLVEARLELNVYELLLRRGRSPGAWIGEAIEPIDLAEVELEPLSAVLNRPKRRRFAACDGSAGFLAVHCHTIEELAADGSVVATRPLEWVAPRNLGLSTLVALPLARAGETIAVGLDDDDLPAAQALSGNSNLLVAPAWRLPRNLAGLDEAWSFVAARLAREHGMTVGERWALGGPYAPSAGLTPELAHPWAFAVRSIRGGARSLTWVSLAECVAGRASIADGHARVVLLRAAHALGLLEP